MRFARQLRRECWGQFEPLFRAGRAINHITRYEQVHDDQQLRDDAQRLLDRATQLRPRNAVAWLEFGVALKKRGGLQVDAFRAIRRAFDLADRFPDSTPPDAMAEMDFQRARHLQNWIDGRRWLADEATIPLMTPSCSSLGAFCENYTRPAAFNALLKDAHRMSIDLEAARRQVLSWYARVLRRAPDRVEAAERTGRELALGDEWEALLAFSLRMVGEGKEPVFFHAVEALSLEKLGRLARADSLFRATIPQLPAELRHWYLIPPKGLDSVPDFWQRARPSWLTPFNELELEYWTRVTYALLVFADREAEVAGPDTPQGDMLVRYGFPLMRTQVEADASRVQSQGRMDDLIAEYLDCTVGADGTGNVGPPQCGDQGQAGYTRDFTMGTWLFWTYDFDQPSLIFELKAAMRVPRYMFDGIGDAYAIQLHVRDPLTFRSQLAPRQFRLPVQVTRFRGDSADRTAVLVSSILPASLMDLPPNDTLRVGFFLFRNAPGFPSAVRQIGDYVPGQAIGLDYRTEVGAGTYHISLEAFAAALGTGAKVRDSLRAPMWNGDSLTTSDILVAHRLDSRVAGEPRSWRDMGFEASRTLEVTPGTTLWLLWETYGLGVGEQGTARSGVQLELRGPGPAQRSAPLRLLERLGLVRPVGPAVSLEWTSERRPAPDGRVLEYVAVQLPAEARGAYQFVVTVTDPATGRTTTTSRPISIAAP